MVSDRSEFKDLMVIERERFIDSRGSFKELYNKRQIASTTANNFVQDNLSVSKYGVIRGLHYQLKPHAQAKLVMVIHGEVLDVVLDLRKGSTTFGKLYSIILSERNGKQLFVPPGFAHGFAVLSESATFFYKCDEYYHPEIERGILYNDPELNIDWQIPKADRIVSIKDQKLPLFKNAEFNF